MYGVLREEPTIGDEQFGCMPGRGKTEAIFAVRQHMEKHQGKQTGLHMVFMDLEKACDRVPRQNVWRCMREKGVPEKCVRIIQDMNEGATTQVKSSVNSVRIDGQDPSEYYGCVGLPDKGSISVVHVICG